MDKPACGHPEEAVGAETVCEHLVAPTGENITAYRWYTGRGMESEVLCESCSKDRQELRQVAAKPVCRICLEHLLKRVVDLEGVRGQPEARESLAPLTAHLETMSAVGIVDLAPIVPEPHCWLLLDGEDNLTRVNLRLGTRQPISTIRPVRETAADRETWPVPTLRLHTSSDAQFAAVVNDYGRKGIVVETATGRTTMELNGGDYFPETVPFALSFAEFEGRSVLVHRTDWNRLDVSDPQSGQVLT